MNKKEVKKMTLIALYIALILVTSKIEIRISDFRFHLGNAMCLFAAFMLRPVDAGLTSGLGSMLFDILFYTSGLGCIVTFITKFVMGFVASMTYKILNRKKEKKDVKIYTVILAGAFGEVAYIILYAIKTYIERRFILSMALEAVIPIMWVKISASVLNAVVAIIISTVLYNFIGKTRGAFEA